jgi:hypothetical protein
MALYLGYFHPTENFFARNEERVRSEGSGPDPKLRDKVIQLPDVLPAGCKLIGAYNPIHSGAVFGSIMPPEDWAVAIRAGRSDAPSRAPTAPLAAIDRVKAGNAAWCPDHARRTDVHPRQ